MAKGKAYWQQGVIVQVDEQKIDHINTVLQGSPEKITAIFERAFDRGLKSGKAQAHREIRQRYDITEQNLQHYYTVLTKTMRDWDGLVGVLDFAGQKIPLWRFHPVPKNRQYTNRFVNEKAGRGWRVTQKVRAISDKASGLREYPNEFIATMPSTGHTGIFKRIGEKTWRGTDGGTRYRHRKSLQGRPSKNHIRELWGYAAADMLKYEPAREAIQKRAKEIVEKNLDHELMRALEQKR